MWPIDRLLFYVRNPKENDAAVDRMCSSIREFGFKILVLGLRPRDLVPLGSPLPYGRSQPIRLLIWPVKVRSRELTVCPRSHIRRLLQATVEVKARM